MLMVLTRLMIFFGLWNSDVMRVDACNETANFYMCGALVWLANSFFNS